MAVVDAVNLQIRRVPPWTLYALGALYGAWHFWLALTGQGSYAVEPINVLERQYGDLALKLLILGLAVTPLRRWPGLNLMKFRRAIGVLAFFFVLAHFLVFAVLDVQSLGRVWTEIVKRPYVTVGMAAFLMLIPLGITSNTVAVRRMGGMAWRRLHKLVYPAAILAAVHYLWLVKGFQIEPIVYLAIILGLLATRLRLPRRLAWSPNRPRGRVAGGFRSDSGHKGPPPPERSGDNPGLGSRYCVDRSHEA